MDTGRRERHGHSPSREGREKGDVYALGYTTRDGALCHALCAVCSTEIDFRKIGLQYVGLSTAESTTLTKQTMHAYACQTDQGGARTRTAGVAGVG